MENINKIVDYEEGHLDSDEEIKMFQRMINDGSVWKLQGSYGRQAMQYLEAGLCELGEKGCYDYWGNYVPSKYEVKPGTKGAPLNTRQKED